MATKSFTLAQVDTEIQDHEIRIASLEAGGGQVNQIPTSTGIADQAALDGDVVNLNLFALFDDPNGDVLTFSASGLPAGLSIDPVTAVISGAISATASGATGSRTSTVAITAQDGRGGSLTEFFDFTVTNRPVVAGSFPDQVSSDGALISLDTAPAFANPDADLLAFSATGLPSGLSINAATGRVSGTIAAGASSGSPYAAVVSATDPAGSSGTAGIAWVVANVAPTSVLIPPQLNAEGEAIVLDFSTFFSDADADVLTYSATGFPPGVAIDPATGAASGAPAPASATPEVYNCVVRVADADGDYTERAFQWTISATLASLTITGLGADGRTITGAFSEPMTATGAPTGWTLTATSGAQIESIAIGSGVDDLGFSLLADRIIYSDETVTLTYVTFPDGPGSLSGAPLASFANRAVPNASVQTRPVGGGVPAALAFNAGATVDYISDIAGDADSRKFTVLVDYTARRDSLEEYVFANGFRAWLRTGSTNQGWNLTVKDVTGEKVIGETASEALVAGARYRIHVAVDLTADNSTVVTVNGVEKITDASVSSTLQPADNASLTFCSRAGNSPLAADVHRIWYGLGYVPYSDFVDSSGAYLDLGSTGVAGGVTPVFHLVAGDDLASEVNAGSATIGTFTLNGAVSDAGGAGGSNAAPVWGAFTVADVQAGGQSLIPMSGKASDENGDPLAYSILSGPAYATLSQNVLALSPPAGAAPGAVDLTLGVSDGVNDVVSIVKQFSVTAPGSYAYAETALAAPFTGWWPGFGSAAPDSVVFAANVTQLEAAIATARVSDAYTAIDLVGWDDDTQTTININSSGHTLGSGIKIFSSGSAPLLRIRFSLNNCEYVHFENLGVHYENTAATTTAQNNGQENFDGGGENVHCYIKGCEIGNGNLLTNPANDPLLYTRALRLGSAASVVLDGNWINGTYTGVAISKCPKVVIINNLLTQHARDCFFITARGVGNVDLWFRNNSSFAALDRAEYAGLHGDWIQVGTMPRSGSLATDSFTMWREDNAVYHEGIYYNPRQGYYSDDGIGRYLSVDRNNINIGASYAGLTGYGGKYDVDGLLIARCSKDGRGDSDMNAKDRSPGITQQWDASWIMTLDNAIVGYVRDDCVGVIDAGANVALVDFRSDARFGQGRDIGVTPIRPQGFFSGTFSVVAGSSLPGEYDYAQPAQPVASKEIALAALNQMINSQFTPQGGWEAWGPLKDPSTRVAVDVAGLTNV